MQAGVDIQERLADCVADQRVIVDNQNRVRIQGSIPTEAIRNAIGRTSVRQ